ncbi:MAG: zinc-dependent metalloprotease [Acidimicrobiales bacterium]|nr:zinc-dependent metalloprotease [Acidimicrobiales bacterium]
MESPVDWDLARRVAVRVSGREQYSESYHYASLEPDFSRFTAEAEELVAETTGLHSSLGSARARVADRPMWIGANIASFQRLLGPLTDKLGERMNRRSFNRVARGAGGVEVGVVLGWMSTRVLGQYDLLLVEDDRPEDQDLVYYVGPNILALEKKHGFPPEEFRLWLALHECTHRAQFTGIPWLRDHFVSLVNATIDSVDPDPGRLVEAAKAILEARRRGEDALADGGVAALLATPEQRELLNRIAGMMSLLEGHGDVTMDRAGADRVPSAERFSGVLRARRNSARGVSRLFQRLIGLEAKLNQYEAGEKFIAAVEQEGGPALVDRAWEGPENLPTLDEIRAPQTWIDRVEGGGAGSAASAHAADPSGPVSG